MESARLLIRPMEDGDESAFVRGVADRDLRAAYGFPVDMEEDVSVQIFRHFEPEQVPQCPSDDHAISFKIILMF